MKIIPVALGQRLPLSRGSPRDIRHLKSAGGSNSKGKSVFSSMNISATIKNTASNNEVSVSTEGNLKTMTIPGKPTGGSAINGGELLFLSLATCFCNDLYREAARRAMKLEGVEVIVSGEFGKEGEAGFNIQYQAYVQSSESTPQQIAGLIRDVDQVAEIHNTLRKGVSVTLKQS